MEEARRVLERLSRIEQLEQSQAPPDVLLAEVRALLGEAEAWARTDAAALDPAVDALERVRQSLEAPFVAATRR